MYLMYVDESGDTGLTNSPTNYFILSGVILHESNWRKLYDDLLEFRKNLKRTRGLKLDDEIHATEFINSPGDLKRIKRNDRLAILKKCIDWLSAHSEITVLTVVVDKADKKGEVFELAWSQMIKGFEQILGNRKLPHGNPAGDTGIILPDNTDGQKLVEIARRLQSKSANQPGDAVQYVIEDPLMRDSQYSYFHQMVDVVAYFARQLYEQNRFVRKFGGHNFYFRLSPVVSRHLADCHSVGILEI